jgi:pimeloyl-ACP methyl ester carboxylesterase
MSKIKSVFQVFFGVCGFIFLLSLEAWATPDPVAEVEVRGGSGIKLEIYQRPPNAKKPGEKRPTSPRPKPPSRPQPAPQFPGDLTVSEGIKDAKHRWFLWNPNGANNYPTTPQCTQEALRDLIWKNPRACDQGQAVNGWVYRCNDQISSQLSRHSFLPLIKFATVDYNFLDNPYIRSVKATLPDGRVLTGFIAMKQDDKPRPFIIAKCGALCNAQQSTTHRAFMMHLFDESPFHVLSLANVTGSDFQRNNKAFSLGGFDEGRQLYQIAQLVKSPDSPIANRISSVHVVGASLGGSGALFSGLYSSMNDFPGQPSIQSVTAVCPVVVLEKSAKRLFMVKPISTVASFETLKQLREVFDFVPVLGRVLPSGWSKLRDDKLYAKLTEAVFQYYRDWTAKQPWDLQPFKGTRITSLQQFWGLNDFRNYIGGVKVPTLAIAAENDDLVHVDENSKLLKESLKKTPNPYIDTIFFKQGNHCAFDVTNGWGNYSMLLREYVLSHSPESAEHWKVRTVRLPELQMSMRTGERIVQTIWAARDGDANIQLKFKIFSPQAAGDQLACTPDYVFNSDPRCYREERKTIPIQALPLEVNDAPVGAYEVTSLTRFANTRFSLLDENGQLVTNSYGTPTFVQMWNWE